MRLGILALQGDFDAHQKVLAALGQETSLIRTPEKMEGIDGLVLPGGESTAIWLLMEKSDLLDPVGEWVKGGRPTLATCAGAVICAREIDGTDQPTFGAVEVTARRNAYGTQRESFEAPLTIPSVGEEPFPGVFIRAPKFLQLGKGVESLCDYDGVSVLARAGNVFLCAFHPELTEDTRLHAAFLEGCGAKRPTQAPS